MVRSVKSEQPKQSTDKLIDESIAQQRAWLEKRRLFARSFFKSLNVFAKPNPNKRVVGRPAVKSEQNQKKSVLREYWFPILCAFIVIFVTIGVLCNRIRGYKTNVQPVPEPVVRTVATEINTPMFDIVRIGDNGAIIVAGRWKPDTGVSVFINKKLTATIMTDKNGEFVYAPSRVALKPGNYTIYLMDVNSKVKSADNVFIYISDAGSENSVSLLMTKNGSRVLQAPSVLRDGDLTVSKVDYMSNGRMVVTGDGLPRMRVSVALNDDVLGMAKVSDYKHFGLGADVGELTPGNEYTLHIRMHDGDGNVIANVDHKFVMPQMTGDDDTYYTVRRGDCLWIIARNFMRRGILFSMIAARNNIENPDLIYPKQKLNIPVQPNK